MVALSFGPDAVPVHAGLIAILVMGYGDGLAAVIGTAYGKHPLVFGKSVEGTVAMFVASFAVTAIAMLVVAPAGWLLSALVVAVVATAVELVTPKGLDNLSVPGVAFLAYLLITLII